MSSAEFYTSVPDGSLGSGIRPQPPNLSSPSIVLLQTRWNEVVSSHTSRPLSLRCPHLKWVTMPALGTFLIFVTDKRLLKL